MTKPAPKMRIGDLLIEEGLLSQEQLEQALARQKTTGQMLGEVLAEQGVISGAVLVQTLAKRLGIRGCQLRHGLIDPALIQLIGEEEAERLKVVPLFKVHETLTVAMAEPQSLPTIDRLRQLTDCKINPVLALEANIKEFINKYSSGNVDVDAFLTSLVESDVEVVERETIDEGPTTDLDNMSDRRKAARQDHAASSLRSGWEIPKLAAQGFLYWRDSTGSVNTMRHGALTRV